MRLGVFGGSFDPVHNGHLSLARACQQQAALDEVWFMPTAIQPLKREGPRASDAERLEMLRLAIGDEQAWRICSLEMDRGGLSYTVDTLRQLREELPEAALFFLIGSDAIREVPRWKEPREIFQLATPLVVHRPGEPDPDLASLRSLCTNETEPQVVEMQPVNISSSEIRRRLGANEPIGDFVPRAVAAYVAAQGLYDDRARET